MGDRISVLVVEDEALIRMDVVDYLEREGFEVHQAAHAAGAIEILENLRQSQLFSPILTCPAAWTD